MSLHRFRRQYEQLSHFKNRRIIGMMKAGGSTKEVAQQLGPSDYVAQVAPSLVAPVSSRTIGRRLGEEHLGSRRPLCVLLSTPTHRRLRLKWFRAGGNWTAVE
ncbi:transposable element Tcb2 transposase [Trichonephila clavipes]|nr:transposable element Tcb2 transposase [Trichonephila clavipes]